MVPDSTHSDQQLLTAYAQTRSEEAFAQVVNRHKDWVYSMCLRRLGNNSALAEDATQAVLLAMAQKAALVSSYESVPGWLYNAARYASANLRKHEQRRARREAEHAQMKPVLSNSDPAAAWDDLRGCSEARLTLGNTVVFRKQNGPGGWGSFHHMVSSHLDSSAGQRRGRRHGMHAFRCSGGSQNHLPAGIRTLGRTILRRAD